jgi:hypothetical protein
MSDESKENQPRHSFTWPFTIALVFVLVIYPLSVGPVAVLFYRGILPEIVTYPYRPLIWISERAGMEMALGSYIKFWCKITDTKP